MSGAETGEGGGAGQDRVRAFTEFRQRMNQRILAEPNQGGAAFLRAGTPRPTRPARWTWKTKELLGLVASLVLRCDDCISYHVAQCKEAGVSREEFFETFSVGLVVGGSIVIPHLRRAVDFLDTLEAGEAARPGAARARLSPPRVGRRPPAPVAEGCPVLGAFTGFGHNYR